MTQEELNAQIEQALADPKQVSAGGTTTQQHSLSELIEAHKYLSNQAAAASRGRLFGTLRIKPNNGRGF